MVMRASKMKHEAVGIVSIVLKLVKRSILYYQKGFILDLILTKIKKIMRKWFSKVIFESGVFGD